MAIIAMALAWWLDHRALSEKLRAAEKRAQFRETLRIFDMPTREKRPIQR
jgi:hypothetical protein